MKKNNNPEVHHFVQDVGKARPGIFSLVINDSLSSQIEMEHGSAWFAFESPKEKWMDLRFENEGGGGCCCCPIRLRAGTAFQHSHVCKAERRWLRCRRARPLGEGIPKLGGHYRAKPLPRVGDEDPNWIPMKPDSQMVLPFQSKEPHLMDINTRRKCVGGDGPLGGSTMFREG